MKMRTWATFVRGVYGHKSVYLCSKEEDGGDSCYRIAGEKPWAGGKDRERIRIDDADHFIESIEKHFSWNPQAISHPSVFDKAEAYDKVMGSKKKTLKDYANFFGVPVALNYDGEVLGFSKEPTLHYDEWSEDDTFAYWDLTHQVFSIDGKEVLDHEGVWESSLTFPDNWVKE